MAAKESKESKESKDSFVSRLVKDPSRPPETLLLQGFPGDSPEKGHRRLYLDLQLENWVDVPDELVLHTEDVREPSGLAAALVWVRRDAMDRLRFRTPLHGHIPTPFHPPPFTVFGPGCPPTPWGGFCPPTPFPVRCPPTPLVLRCPPTPWPVRCPPTPVGIRCSTVLGCPWPPGGGTLTTAICPSAIDACPSAPAGCDWITPHIQTPVIQPPEWGGGAWGGGGFGGGGFGGGGFGGGGFGFGQ